MSKMAQTTPVAMLQELTVKQRLVPPSYRLVSEASETHKIAFSFQVSVAGIQVDGSGSSKKIAKHQAAYNALEKLKEMGKYVPADDFECKAPSPPQNSPYNTPITFVSDLVNLCLKHKIAAPEFYEVSSVGPDHAKEFTYQCKISSIKTEGKGNSKKMAKQMASRLMLQKIQEILPDLIAESEKFMKFMEKDATAVGKPLDTLTKLMKLKNVTYEELAQDLKEGTDESLKIILEKLKLSYEISEIQANPFTAALTLHTQPPFVMMGMGGTREEAVQNALKQTFTIMNCFLKKM